MSRRDPPWEVGQRPRFVTFDNSNADLRDLDYTVCAVMELNAEDPRLGEMLVMTDYGELYCDPFDVVADT